MKAPAFKYARPQSVAETLALLAEHGGDAKILAGGQSLMPMLNLRVASPSVLIDINRLNELAGIRVEGASLRIGALTRHHEVADSPLVRQHLPLISEAMRHVAHAAVRNRGTFGGSLAMADPAAEMPACSLALGATMLVDSVRGRRTIPADEFFKGVFETAIGPDELLVAVDIPITERPRRHAFGEFARRHGDFALVGGAIDSRLVEGRVADLRLVMFGVGDRPIRARRAERAIAEVGSIAEGIAGAQQALSDDLTPFSDSHASAGLRLHLARVLVARLLGRIGQTSRFENHHA